MVDLEEEFKNERKDEMTCRECGKKFYGYYNKYGKYVKAAKQLAGHILRSDDHEDKYWAKMYIYGHVKKSGLWCSDGGLWG